MTTTVQENIEKALLDRVVSLVLSPVLLVAWPNRPFPGKDSSGVAIAKPLTYLAVSILPNNNTRFLLDGSGPSMYQGILQIVVVSPLDKGTQTPTRIAGLVAEHFPADMALFSGGTRVTLTKAPDVASPLKNDVSWDVPISIYYEAFA